MYYYYLYLPVRLSTFTNWALEGVHRGRACTRYVHIHSQGNLETTNMLGKLMYGSLLQGRTGTTGHPDTHVDVYNIMKLVFMAEKSSFIKFH